MRSPMWLAFGWAIPPSEGSDLRTGVTAIVPDTLFGHGTLPAGLAVGVSDLFVPLAEAKRLLTVPLLVAAQFCFSIGLTVLNVNSSSIRQAATPNELLGRVSATARTRPGAVIPVGALSGGLLGEVIGPRETLILAVLGETLAAAWWWKVRMGNLEDLPSTSVRLRTA